MNNKGKSSIHPNLLSSQLLDFYHGRNKLDQDGNQAQEGYAISFNFNIKMMCIVCDL